MPRLPTGLPVADAQDDFNRARRHQILARIAARLRGEPSDFNLILPFEEVADALGYAGERDLGLQTIELDSIVGTVDRSRDFDRSFRPTSTRTRTRWERISAAQYGGKPLPPISVYRIGQLHFVRDGHHRVSVARSRGWSKIDAYVTEVFTKVGADAAIRLADLPMKGHERLFYERVPLNAEARKRIEVRDPWRYAELAEAVEAWGFRAMQSHRELMTREEVAERWFREEYVPVVEMLHAAALIGKNETETEAYMRIAAERYRLMRTHAWTEEVIERLRRDLS